MLCFILSPVALDIYIMNLPISFGIASLTLGLIVHQLTLWGLVACTIWHHRSESTLVLVIACSLFRAKPLPEPVQWNLNQTINILFQEYAFENDVHKNVTRLVYASTCSMWDHLLFWGSLLTPWVSSQATHTPKVTTHSAVVTSSSLRQYRSY